MKYYYLLIVFSLWLISCGRPESDIAEFDDIFILENPQKVYCDSQKPLGRVRSFRAIDSILIVDCGLGNFAFTFINLNDGKVAAEWGKIGQGPGEFPDFSSGFQVDDSSLIFECSGLTTMNSVRISDILSGDDIEVISENIPYIREFRPKNIVAAGNLRIATGSYTSGSSMGVYNSNCDIEDYVFPMPFECSYVEPLYQGSAFQGQIAISDDQSTVARAYFASDIFEIFSVENGTIKKKFTYKFQCPPKALNINERYTLSHCNNVEGIFNLRMDNTRICFQYSGKDYDAPDANGTSNEILCFDHDGRKIMKLILPFVIDDYCLYGDSIIVSALEGEDYVFYKYILPSGLLKARCS